MSDAPRPDAPGAPPPEDATLDEMPVQLVFELGRRTLPLGELRAADAGFVFDLGRGADQAVDIVANGRRIGSGEVVRVGDGLGVRVARLFGHD